MARILAVDDTPHNLDLVTYLLAAAGHEVITATTGSAAIEAARSARPVLVVLDVQLPDIDGYGVLQALRSDPDLAKLTVVAVTAYAMVGDRAHALTAGFDGYLSKPIDPLTFADTIGSFLGTARPARDLADVAELADAAESADVADLAGVAESADVAELAQP